MIKINQRQGAYVMANWQSLEVKVLNKLVLLKIFCTKVSINAITTVIPFNHKINNDRKISIKHLLMRATPLKPHSE